MRGGESGAPANGGRPGVMGARPLGVKPAGVSEPLLPKAINRPDIMSPMVAKSCFVLGCIVLARS